MSIPGNSDIFGASKFSNFPTLKLTRKILKQIGWAAEDKADSRINKVKLSCIMESSSLKLLLHIISLKMIKVKQDKGTTDHYVFLTPQAHCPITDDVLLSRMSLLRVIAAPQAKAPSTTWQKTIAKTNIGRSPTPSVCFSLTQYDHLCEIATVLLLHWFFFIRTSYFFLSLNVLIFYSFWASKCS